MSDDEIFLFYGREELIKPQILMLINIKQMLDGRDVGQIIGSPIHQLPHNIPKASSVVIHLFDKSTEPFGNCKTTPQITIPNVDRDKIANWQALKQACGGKNGYQHGPAWATATLANGYKLTVQGAANKSLAKTRVKALAVFSEAPNEIIHMNNSQDEEIGVSAPGNTFYKERVTVYPGYIAVCNQRRIAKGKRGSADYFGKLKRQQAKFNLWTEEPPPGYAEMIREALSAS